MRSPPIPPSISYVEVVVSSSECQRSSQSLILHSTPPGKRLCTHPHEENPAQPFPRQWKRQAGAPLCRKAKGDCNSFQTLKMLHNSPVDKAFYIMAHDVRGFTLDLHFSNGYASTVRSFGSSQTPCSAWRHSEPGKARSFLTRFSHILFRQGVVNTVVWRLRELTGSCSGWPRRKVAGNGL